MISQQKYQQQRSDRMGQVALEAIAGTIILVTNL